MESFRQHGGDIYRFPAALDFSVNINPLGMPEAVRDAAMRAVAESGKYPDTRCRRLCRALAEQLNVPENMVLCGNGAVDLIYRFCLALRPKTAWILTPAFSEYEAALRVAGSRITYVSRRAKSGFYTDVHKLAQQLRGTQERPQVLFFCNPSNPDGELLTAEEAEELAAVCEELGIYIVLDECFCALTDEQQRHTLLAHAAKYPHLLILRAFTKTYAMAGLRLGYAVCAGEGILEQMRESGQPWSVSVPAEAAGLAALCEQAYVKQAVRLIRTERKFLAHTLEAAGYRVFSSGANYLLFYDKSGEDLWEWLLEKGILIRDCKNYRDLGEGYYRIGVRTTEENRRLAMALADRKSL